MYFTQKDGVKTHFDVWDIGTKNDTLFLHGNLASNRWWQPLLSHMPKTQNVSRAICAEWRGCGLSDAPRSESELKPEVLSQDMSALIDSELERKSKINIVGHSTGGLIGTILACSNPQRISSLVLIDSVGPTGVKFEPDFLKLFDTMQSDKATCTQVLMSTVHGVDTNTFYFARLADDAYAMAEHNWRGVLNGLTGIDIREKLKKVTCPVLVLHGEHDAVCPKEDAKVYGDLLPNARYVELDGRGHCPIVEDPARVAFLLSEFLN